jgi:hypothetical protein
MFTDQHHRLSHVEVERVGVAYLRSGLILRYLLLRLTGLLATLRALLLLLVLGLALLVALACRVRALLLLLEALLVALLVLLLATLSGLVPSTVAETLFGGRPGGGCENMDMKLKVRQGFPTR